MLHLFLFLFVLLLTAFFSGIEFAFVSSNRLKTELIKQNGGIIGQCFNILFHKPSHFFSTTLVANSISIVLLTLLSNRICSQYFETLLPEFLQFSFIYYSLEILLTTIIVLIIGEFLPKILFRSHPERIIQIFAIPMIFVYYLLYR